ncbi:MAG: hypothetical protein A2W91_15495 [Bacteroidetes bacterium GWF2_38_335]|nr:MAG: hypothetical protein A2W91_15495 [Bacteroidetes bacterium GWF2_38_335]OFY81500.1 MAG: hypothetical protein A2281_11355 [Bacteroidetes bacterium RIFOXYA12_FULL_38_20]HBS87666.1 UDP-N-acetylmuramoyl-tripeptide--D-alanyl-D-alanine ligase [Bacteroidales bacterium]
MENGIENLYKILHGCKFKIATDTRDIKGGEIFFALKGDNFNGNTFVSEALRQGCSYAVTDEIINSKSENVIKVENVLHTLQQLANYHRKILNIPILAITGTNGKTTTKELSFCVLSKKYHTSCTKGNLNNHIGVPLTLLSFNSMTEIGVVEMGANHIGEIDFLCKIAEPDYGLITNIGKAHIEGFGSYEGVITAKSELYNYLNNIKAPVFYNSDNSILNKLYKSKPVGYALSVKDGFYVKVVDRNPFLEVEIHNEKGEKVKVRSNLFGDYNAENIAAAACIGDYFNISLNEIKSAIESYIPSNNRSQVYQTSKNTLYLDMYNANPTSMHAAISNFAFADGDKVLILGDMLELGKVSANEHREIIALVKKLKFTTVFFAGKEFKSVKDNHEFHFFSSSDELKEFLKANPISGKSLLIKGSRGIKLEKLVEEL